MRRASTTEVVVFSTPSRLEVVRGSEKAAADEERLKKAATNSGNAIRLLRMSGDNRCPGRAA